MQACSNGSHTLVPVHVQEYGETASLIVNWCGYCGAVVIDEEVDGRIAPGSVMKMVFPHLAKEHLGK
jgi:hypothetical protein